MHFFSSTPICMHTMHFVEYGASKSTKLFLLTCIIICRTKKMYACMFSELYSTTTTCVFNITHRLLILIILHIKFHLEYCICASQLFDILIHYSYVFNILCHQWSFGVTCWEVLTCGGVPYAGVRSMTLLTELHSGHRLERPSNAVCSSPM